MKNQVLSIEQMKRLKDLGVDISRASLFYDINYGGELDIVKYPERLKEYIAQGKGIGAFTLHDVIALLPYKISEPGKYKCAFFKMECRAGGVWVVKYSYGLSGAFRDVFFKGIDLLEITYYMLEWIAYNGFLNQPNIIK